jgi:hypothetical protein
MKKLGRNAFLGAAGLALAAALSAPALAHHSAAHFDFANPVQVTGVVKEARFSNPHARIILEVTDDKGTRDVEYEGHSRNNMYRQGFRPGMMAVGDKITLQIAPARDGTDGGYVTALITADGQSIGRIAGAD